MIAFDCPSCGKHFSFSDRFAGRKMICSGCKSDIIVPEPQEEPQIPSVSAPIVPPISSTTPALNPTSSPPIIPSGGFGSTPSPSFQHDESFSGIPSSFISSSPPDSAGFDSSAPFSDEASHSFDSTPASSEDMGSSILAYVFEERREETRQTTAAVPPGNPVSKPKTPEETPAWKKNLVSWGSFGLIFALVLGLALYLTLYVDWRGSDSRLALLERLEQQRIQAVKKAGEKETEVGHLRLRALGQWNEACETIDAYIVTLGALDEKRLDLADMDKTLRLHAQNESQTGRLAPKRAEIAGAIKMIEDRLAQLRERIDSGIQSAAADEIAADTAFSDSKLFEAESEYYGAKKSEINDLISKYPNDRIPVSTEPFDAEKNRVVPDPTIRFDRDWTENDFKEFSFPDSVPERFAATFDGTRRLHGDKSLRVSILEKLPISIRFPSGENARTVVGPIRFMSFSLRFPELQDAIVIGSDPETGKIGEMRVRLGNSAGYVQFQTISPRFCESICYDGCGQFITVELPVNGDVFWKRSDHFDMSKFEPGDLEDDSLDSVATGQANEPSFFSRIDWAEIRFSPLSDRTTLWIDGIVLTEQKTRAPYDLLRAETLQKERRAKEKEFFIKRRSAPRSSTIFSLSPNEKISGGGDEDKSPESGSQAPPKPSDEIPNHVPDEAANETLEERTRKLFQWVLQEGKGQIQARQGGSVLSFDVDSTVPKSFDGMVVEAIDLRGFQRLHEDRLDQIGSFTSLKHLNLSQTALKNKDVVRLAALTSLESLNLSGNSLTFESMPSLRTLKNLVDLNIGDIQTSAAGIDALGSLTSLRSLSMARSGIDGADLTYLLPLADLEILDISSTKISDRGLTAIRVFDSLRILNISKTRISNKALSSLDALRKLEVLRLDGTNLDDDCLEYIGKVPNLETVSALETKITKEGVRKKLGNAWVAKFKLSPESGPK